MNYHFFPFSVDYPPITSPIEDFKIECIIAAQKAIESNYKNLPIVVMMSGGIDSELVAESLRLAHIPFKAVIGILQATFAGNTTIFNTHDYAVAERWCIKNNIDILYCPIEIYEQSTLLSEYAISACGFSPQYACHMYIMKWCQTQGYFFIAGNGELDFKLHNGDYYMVDEQREFVLANFCRIHHISCIWQFWKQDARLAAAFLKLPTVQRLMNERVPEILKFKHQCLGDVFDFEPRDKHTGFESIQEWDAALRNPMKKIMGHFDANYYTSLGRFKYVLE